MEWVEGGRRECLAGGRKVIDELSSSVSWERFLSQSLNPLDTVSIKICARRGCLSKC